MQAQKAEGTRDLIGAEMRAWQKMQQIAAGVFEPFGFKPIETPAIEQVDVFVHGIGQSTDVVRKEMFRVFSGANLERVFTEGTDTKLKPKQRLALRPEGTAGVVRAVVENNLVPQGSTPFKAYYAEAMFRGERPQKGRLRQFHQSGRQGLRRRRGCRRVAESIAGDPRKATSPALADRRQLAHAPDCLALALRG